MKFLSHLRLGFSHLNQHRFRYNFQDCLNPLCSSNKEIEDTSHYLLHCHIFSYHCIYLMNSAKSACDNFEPMPHNVKKDLLLFRDSPSDENKNKVIQEATISY